MPEMREMRAEDLERVSAIYASHTGAPPPASFQDRVRRLFEDDEDAVALVAEENAIIVGYVVAEVRSWEFGSSPAGWVFGLSVDHEHEGRGIAHALLERALAKLRSFGVATARTMVREDDVAVLRLFRSGGFKAGPYTELEISLLESP